MPGMDWEEIEKRLKREAEEEEARGAADRLSEIIADDIKGILSMSEDQLRAELIRDFGIKANSAEFNEALSDYRKAIQAAKGGLFSTPDIEKARKIIKKNETLDKVNDKTKSWWDCTTVIIAIMFALTGVGYGISQIFI